MKGFLIIFPHFSGSAVDNSSVCYFVFVLFFLAMNFKENHFSLAKSNQWLPLLVLFSSSQGAKFMLKIKCFT